MTDRVREVDRFLLPAEAPAVERYLVGALWAPHGLSERLARSVRRVAGGRLTRGLVRGLSPLGARAPSREWARELEALESVLASPLAEGLAGGPGDPSAWSWLLLRGYSGRRRGRTTAFLLADDADRGETGPAAVVKLRALESGQGGLGPPLAAERDALVHLAERFSEPLARTVPPVLGHGCVAGREALLLGGLPGRAAYVEVRGTLAPGRRVGVHLRLAADWLARFQRATRGGCYEPPPPAELGLSEPAPSWYRRVAEAAAAGRLPQVSAHGDFWARNLLVEDDAAALPAVVDWEEFHPFSGPFEDLFHFPLTYGLVYPAPGYRPRGPLRAFERTFFGSGRLACAVAEYFRIYARAAGLAPDLLGPLFRLFLRLRAAREDDRRRSLGEEWRLARDPEPPWGAFERRLDGASREGEQSVFSG